MKNIQKITFTLLIAITIPVSSALALGQDDTIQVQLATPFGGDATQDVVNSLNNISNSINSQTKALQDSQRQQQIALLDPECVRQLTLQVRAKDGSVQTQQMIDTYRNETMANMSMSDPLVANQASSYLNYLYGYLDAQNIQLYNVLIKYCPQYTASQVQQVAPTSGLQCNGKSWSTCSAGQTFYCPPTGDAQCITKQSSEIQCNEKSWSNCPSGQKFYCPPTGDAQCLLNQQQVISTSQTTSDSKPVIKNEQIQAEQTTVANNKPTKTLPRETISVPPATQGQKPIIKNEQIESEQITKANSDTKTTETSPTDNIQSVAKVQKPVSSSEQITKGNSDTKTTETSPDHKGLLQKLWSWFKGLFGF